MLPKNNPFIRDLRHRFEIAYQLIPTKTKSLLDFGCSNGYFLSLLRSKLPHAKLYGYEVDEKKIGQLKENVSGIQIVDGPLPPRVDIVCLLDVLEHVPSRPETINEIYRVLKPGGVLLFSVPNRGLTEVFDAGNIKFRFPRLHRLLYERVFKKNDYEEVYRGDVLVGDITKKERMWHEHFSLEELERLLGKRFIIKEVHYYGFFYPLLAMLYEFLKGKFHWEAEGLYNLLLKDSRTSWGRFSYSIFIKAVKV